MSATVTDNEQTVTPPEAIKKSWPRRLVRYAFDAGFVLSLVFAALILLPRLAGYQNYVIVGGSMTGTIDRGSMLYTQPVAVAKLKVGDIITYIPPDGQGPNKGEPVTHRIVFIAHDKDGHRVISTKGDANRFPDSWKFVPLNHELPRYSFHIPYMGYVLAALALRPVRLALIGLPALIIAFSIFYGMWKQAGEEMREEQAKASNEPAVEGDAHE